MNFSEATTAENRQAIARERHKLNIDRKHPTAILKTFSEIAPEPIDWLWKDRIALGKLTIYAGDPGLGKSQGSLDLAARLSQGRAFPDGSPCRIGDTIILTSEDDPGDTIRPRLDALEADVSRIHIIRGERNSEGKVRRINLTMVLAFLDAINQIRAMGHDFCLLIIDPLDSFLDGADSNKNEQVREVLDDICNLAEKERFSIVGIKHLNKGNGNAAYRVGGSIAFTAKARSVWVFVEDKENDLRLFLPQKNNLGPPGGGFRYSIQKRDTGGIIAPYISWEGPATDDLQDVLNPLKPGKELTPEREEVLEVLQSAGHSMTTGDISEALGKSPQNVYNLLNRLKEKGKVISPKYGHWQVTPVTPLKPDKPVTPTDEEPSKKQVTPLIPTSVSSVSSVSKNQETENEPEIW